MLADWIAVIGLCLLGYGLWLYEPWVSYAVIGFILMSAGSAMAKNARKDI